MRSYDHRHPKGRKFSGAELIAHRDVWYTKYAGTGGPTALLEHRDLDRTLFRRIMRELPYDGVAQLRNRYGGQPFGRDQLSPLDAFLEECKDPSCEFLDADLEAALAALKAAIADYIYYVSVHVFVSHDQTELVIHPELKDRDPERYYEIVYEIADKEGALVDTYSALVKLARRKLGIEASVV